MDENEIQYIIIYNGDLDICVCENSEELRNKIIKFNEFYSEFIEKHIVQKYITKKYIKKHNIDEVIKTTIEISNELKRNSGIKYGITKIIEINGSFHIHG